MKFVLALSSSPKVDVMADRMMFFGVFPAVNTTVVDKTDLPGAFDVKMSASVGERVERPPGSPAAQDLVQLSLGRGCRWAGRRAVQHQAGDRVPGREPDGQRAALTEAEDDRRGRPAGGSHRGQILNPLGGRR